MNYPDSTRDNIFVLVRIRPQNDREMREGNEICVRVDENRQNAIVLETKPEPKVFTFDWVASRGTSQEDIFNGVGKKLVDTCLEGKSSFPKLRENQKIN
jgi:kinesin family protein 15